MVGRRPELYRLLVGGFQEVICGNFLVLNGADRRRPPGAAFQHEHGLTFVALFEGPGNGKSGHCSAKTGADNYNSVVLRFWHSRPQGQSICGLLTDSDTREV